MKTTLVTLMAVLVCYLPLRSQDTPIKDGKADILLGINITNTLAGFFNSGGQDIAKDPFLFSLKVLKNNKLWRLGAIFKVDARQEQLPNFEFRTVNESEYMLRLGREWMQPINKRFALYYGADAIGSYFLEKSEFESFTNLTSNEFKFGLGFGPFLGVYFNLSERIRLSTETYAYAIFFAGESFTEIGQGVPDERKKIRNLSIMPSVPNSLYIHFSF